MTSPNRTQKGLFILIGLVCLTPWVGPPLALALGILTAFTFGQVFDKQTVHKITQWLLKTSVVGLGFGMNFFASVKAGEKGFVFTLISVFSTLGMGYFLCKKLAVDTKTSMLITSGTAICGGSAIAAISPIINAEDKQISIALGAVFILNSVALFLFPLIGHLIHLNQMQFGYWAAIAIHDTSSVAGAAASYGHKSLGVALSVKMERALWILPLTFVTSIFYKSGDTKVKIPYFILLFVGAMMLNTFIPSLAPLSRWIVPVAKQSLTFTLFLIGTGLSVSVLKSVGTRPLMKAVLLWLFIAVGSLWMVTRF